jgi:hypothetical protein
MGYASSYRNYEYYLTERGALGRGPADWEADIHGDYPIPVGSSRASIVLDVFNVFNRQAKNALDQRYNISPDACGGIPANLCNGDGGIAHVPGTVTPVGELPNPRATAANPNFLQKGTSFTGARSFRLGARFTFYTLSSRGPRKGPSRFCASLSSGGRIRPPGIIKGMRQCVTQSRFSWEPCCFLPRR